MTDSEGLSHKFRQEVARKLPGIVAQLSGAWIGKVRYPGTGSTAKVTIRLSNGEKREVRVQEYQLRRIERQEDEQLYGELTRLLGGVMNSEWLTHLCQTENVYRYGDLVQGHLVETAMRLEGGETLRKVRDRILADARSGRALSKVTNHRVAKALDDARVVIRGALREGASVDDLQTVLNEEMIRTAQEG